ncbi:MAG: hypothetical protein HKN25_07170 [Pyrinomonadaceae bacterium]|nr:hypothetical protein [Pyrinomonadaceae bacterium]
MNNNTLYDFDGFRLDTDQKCLWRGEELVSLTPKAYETLQVLIKNNGKVITKNEILDEVWENTYVEEATLAQNISTLRKALAKYDKTKDFIVTIPRRGYRFVADVTEINSEEEELIVEKHTVTHIVAEHKEIHDSGDAKDTQIQVNETITPELSDSSMTKRLVITVAVAAFVIAGVGFALLSYFSSAGDHYTTKFQKFKVNTLFSGGSISEFAASPDGKYIAVIERKPSGDSIYLKQTKDGNNLEVLPKSDLHILGAAFAVNGDYIFYSGYKKEDLGNGAIGKLYRIPILGGASQEILKDIDSEVAASADGARIAFIRNIPKEKRSALMISDLEGGEEKELAAAAFPETFMNSGLSWSPDTKSIAGVILNRDSKNSPVKLVAIDIETGEKKTLASKDWLWIGRTNWLEDTSGIAFVGYGTKSPNLTDEIWLASYPAGDLRSITNGIRGVSGISMSRDSKSILASKLTRIRSSYVSELNDFENAREIAKTTGEESLLPLGSSWVGEEKIVYSQTKNGDADIWIMNADGTKAKQLTTGEGADYSPFVSPDEKQIYFLSNRKGELGIWSMDLDGQNQTKVISLPNMLQPSFSVTKDGIFYLAKAPDNPYRVLWKSDREGKAVKQVTSKFTGAPKISPDGKFVFCIYPKADSKTMSTRQPLHQTILSAETGKVLKQFEKLTLFKAPVAAWKTDNSGVLVVEDSKLWLKRIDQEKPALVKEWENGTVYQISLSKSGEKVYYQKGEEVISVVELEDSSVE